MKKIFLVATLALSVSSHAEMLENPNANTLWKENGINIATGSGNNEKYWNDALKFTTLPENKGFTIEPTEKVTGGTYVKVSKAYPWFCYKINSVDVFKKAYNAISFRFMKGGTFGQVSKIQPGIYAINIYKNCPSMPEKSDFLRIDQHNNRTALSYIKMVKLPENYIQCSSDVFSSKRSFTTGDKLKFTVTVKDSVDDIVLSFFKSYTMPQVNLDGQDQLQLAPVDKENKVWSGELTVADLGEDFKENTIWIKADTIGGSLSLPLWNVINYEYKK